MMRPKKPVKGSYGYIRDYKRFKGLISGIWLAIVLLLYITGLVIFKTNKNYVTLVAILLVLPGAKAWVASIVMIPYHTQSRKLYDEVVALMKEKSAKVYSDIVVTKYEGAMTLSVIVNYNDNFYAYMPKQKKTLTEVRNYLTEMLASQGLTTKAQVFDNEEKFLLAMKKMAEGPDLEAKKTKALEQQLFSAAL